MHVSWICRRSFRRCVQIPKHPLEKDPHEQRCEMVEHHMEGKAFIQENKWNST